MSRSKQKLLERARRHPVWDVYDEYRTIVYNVKAHARKIHALRRWNLSMDILLAVFTPSSAITGLFLWDNRFGRLSWNILISVAAVIAVAKPLLRIEERVKQLLRSLSGYTYLLHDFEHLKLRISQEGVYSEKLQENFWELMRQKRLLSRSTPLIHLSQKERRLIFAEVNIELPVYRFFVPGV